MSRDDAILSACERLIEALAADLLEAAEDEVLASHTPAAARVAADALRHHLHRASSHEPAPTSAPDVPPCRPPDLAGRPEKKP